MTSQNIRVLHNTAKTIEEVALVEIAAQLAELNERAGDGGFPIQIVGATATDIHTAVVALAQSEKRSRRG